MRLSFKDMRLCLIFGILLTCIACSDDGPSRSQLRIGIGLEPPNLDPTSSAAAAIDEIVYANVFEGLTRINAQGDVQPGLAQSWTVSEDGTRYIFQLHSHVRYHDGSLFDAHDVKFSLDRARANGATNPRPDIFAIIQSVNLLAPDQIEVILKHPSSSFLFNLGLGDAVIIAPESADHNHSHPIGTGPFKFDRWQKGQLIALDRFDDYWGRGAYLDTVIFKIIPDSAAAYAALIAGDVDGFPNFPAPELLIQLDRQDRFSITAGTTEGETIMGMNNARAPFNDLKVRQAISHAINRKTIIEGAMFGYGREIGSFFSPLRPAYRDLTALSAYNRDKAKALLAEAGYESGFEVELKLPPTNYARRSGEIIAAQLGQVGIQVDIRYIEWAQWLDQVLTQHSYDLTIVSHTEPRDLSFFAKPNNYFRYQNKDFNQILSAIERSSDQDIRTQLYIKAQTKLAQDAPAAFLFQLPQLGVWRKDIKGQWQNAPVQAIDVTNVYFSDEPSP